MWNREKLKSKKANDLAGESFIETNDCIELVLSIYLII